MIIISRRLISYECVLSRKNMHHYVLIAHVGRQQILLSHPNLFLRERSASIETTSRYSSVISMFYSYLSTLEKYSNMSIVDYHAVVDNLDVRNWQIYRQLQRVVDQSLTPSTETIIEDGKVVFNFLLWLENNGFPGCMKFEFRTWQPDFKDEQLLSYIRREAKLVLDGRGVRSLDKELRQKSTYSLPTNAELQALIKGYVDPVYAAMFKLSLGTAMRPMDLCKFPYVGNGLNANIMPWPDMDSTGETIVYHVLSKGNKSRKVVVNCKDLEALYKYYIKDHYAPRAERYEKRFGHPCPPSILFLNSRGVPVTRKMISRRTVAARKNARALDPTISRSIKFYDTRHWWPTMYLIKYFGKNLLGDISEVRDMAAMQVLKNQMGHTFLQTTFNHYIDVARMMLLAHEGFLNELLTNPSQSVQEFLVSPAFD
ncbi:site-specific integrase [Pseudomonas taiwanensis]|uniref:site-specific integrase n=1 Tax=Pseudomonas taiwanensis TaxID=470150 RepID=UPI0016460891|nr:site-specific integrase [Pseudomonas taiwanensis]MBC3492424.1 site-specific integrase [Pseudomonas taiwanensis]